MTIHPVESAADVITRDTMWTETPMPTAEPDALEKVMTADGKIYVVVAVLLIVWIGIMVYLYRTDQKIDRLERRVDDSISEDT